jgi:predicted DNA-binding transcriptional regulator YafY
MAHFKGILQMTDFITYQERLDYIVQLAERSSTGTPENLATRLGVSKRTIKRMVYVLREKGIPIKYNRDLRTYQILT